MTARPQPVILTGPRHSWHLVRRSQVQELDLADDCVAEVLNGLPFNGTRLDAILQYPDGKKWVQSRQESCFVLTPRISRYDSILLEFRLSIYCPSIYHQGTKLY